KVRGATGKGWSHVWLGVSGAAADPRDRPDPFRCESPARAGAVARLQREGVQEGRDRRVEGREHRGREEGRREEGVIAPPTIGVPSGGPRPPGRGGRRRRPRSPE